MKENLYINTNDYQGTDFAIGRTLTAKGWKQQAIGWLDSDGAEEGQKYYEDFDETEELRLIDEINDWWMIHIVPFNEYDEEHIRLRKEAEKW